VGGGCCSAGRGRLPSRAGKETAPTGGAQAGSDWARGGRGRLAAEWAGGACWAERPRRATGLARLRGWAAVLGRGERNGHGAESPGREGKRNFSFSFSKQIFQKHFKYKFQLDFELIWNSNQNHSSQNKYATACMHHLQLTLYLILVFTKIIYFLYFNAHQNCLNKSIWLFLENANLGCYNSTPLKMNLVLEIRVIAYSNSWG